MRILFLLGLLFWCAGELRASPSGGSGGSDVPDGSLSATSGPIIGLDPSQPEERCKNCGRRSWRGFYHQPGGNPVFIDCKDGTRYQVLREGDWRALDLAYRKSPNTAQGGLMVRFEGSLVQRQSRPDEFPAPRLLVQSFADTLPNHDCRGPLKTGTPSPR